MLFPIGFDVGLQFARNVNSISPVWLGRICIARILTLTIRNLERRSAEEKEKVRERK